MATYEDARKCPKCGEPGREVHANAVRSGSGGKLVTLQCENKPCRWYGTTWVVQVRPDGSVPDPDTRPRTEGRIIIPSDEDVERIQRNAQAALDGSLRGGEIAK